MLTETYELLHAYTYNVTRSPLYWNRKDRVYHAFWKPMICRDVQWSYKVLVSQIPVQTTNYTYVSIYIPSWSFESVRHDPDVLLFLYGVLHTNKPSNCTVVPLMVCRSCVVSWLISGWRRYIENMQQFCIATLFILGNILPHNIHSKSIYKYLDSKLSFTFISSYSICPWAYCLCVYLVFLRDDKASI